MIFSVAEDDEDNDLVETEQEKAVNILIRAIDNKVEYIEKMFKENQEKNEERLNTLVLAVACSDRNIRFQAFICGDNSIQSIWDKGLKG